MNNTQTIYLSSNTRSVTSILPEVNLVDVTEITINPNELIRDSLISKKIIDWGDGSDLYVNSDIPLRDYRKDSIIPEVLYGDFSKILFAGNDHVYSPSETSDTLLLTAQFLVEYMDTNISLFIIPIKITCGSFYDNVGDIGLLHTNLIPVSSNNINLVLSTKETGHIVEVTT
jgi:hypothetical protein